MADSSPSPTGSAASSPPPVAKAFHGGASIRLPSDDYSRPYLMPVSDLLAEPLAGAADRSIARILTADSH